MEKARAAESVEEEASRAAAAKAASISQINWSFLNANASKWQGRTEKKALEIRLDKKSKHSVGSSVNTVDFLAFQAISPQRKGSTSKRVQINELSDSSGTIDHKNNIFYRGRSRFSQQGYLMKIWVYQRSKHNYLPISNQEVRGHNESSTQLGLTEFTRPN